MNGSIPYLLLALGGLILVAFISLFVFHIKKTKKANASQKDEAALLNKEIAPAGFAYDRKQDIFYSLMECWQKDFGYCRLYDEGAPTFSMIIDCEPIYFNYDGKAWLIEFWKGQYGMTTGGEIGIYYQDAPVSLPWEASRASLYKAAEKDKMLPVSFILKKQGEILFYRNENHWWLTGFKMALFSQPSDLTMEIRITFPNTAMLNAFLNGMYDAGYSPAEIEVKYRTVMFTYDKPHTRQPALRNLFTESFMQAGNRIYCQTYDAVTKDYDTTLEKLAYLKDAFPDLYKHLLNLGKARELFLKTERKG